MSDEYVDPLDAISGHFVTTRQAADILGVPVNTVAQWCRLGVIASRKLGGRYRIPKWVVRNLRRVRVPPQPMAKRFLRLKEAAPLLEVRANTLYQWCKAGKIPCRRVGNRYELSQRTVQMLLERFEERYLDEPRGGRLI